MINLLQFTAFIEPCVDFLEKQCQSLGLQFAIYHPVNEKNPLVTMTWPGTQPDLPAIVLNSHMDVVPVFENMWTHPPFAAHMDEEGRIYARGAQDMKCVGMQYLAAIRLLKKDGVTLKRTVIVMYVPDEEKGGKLGMAKFVDQEDFKKLNVGFSLDEGLAAPDDVFPIFYAERSIWHIVLRCRGTPGHGSLLLKGTAGEKVRYMIDKMMDMRRHEENKLENNPELELGDVTTVNLTMLEGGIQNNVLPPELSVMFDIRLALEVNHDDFLEQIKTWCSEAGGNIEIEFEQKDNYVAPTQLTPDNIFWIAFKSAVDQMGLKVKTKVFPGGTDSRFIRMKGVPALGFSPMNNTPVLLHDHNEFLKADTYLRGIEIYKGIIPKLANA